ncbi:hypothetical protein BDR26DRAFT_858649 [Obelidium mucronatum]|nr:hypothetical protein BDR26DRAFT_858649 [Obelidium mucronatum]
MLQTYMQRLKRVDRDLLLHFTLVHAYFGMVEDAFAILERFITLPPYSEDSVLVGYAGLLSFTLWRIQTERLKESASQERDSQSYHFALSQTTIDDTDEDNFNSSYYRNSLLFFKKSLELPHGFANDLFVSCYVKILLMNDDFVSAESVLQTFRAKAPLDPNSTRYLLEFYHMHPSNTINFRELATTMLQQDPICEPQLALIPLIEYKESELIPSLDLAHLSSCLEIVAILAHRLDHDRTPDIWIWNKLIHYILLIRSMDPLGDQPVWLDRRHWWLDLHAPVTQTYSTTNTFDYAVLKSIALYLILGSSSRYIHLFPFGGIDLSIEPVFPRITYENLSPVIIPFMNNLTPSELFFDLNVHYSLGSGGDGGGGGQGVVFSNVPACLLQAPVSKKLVQSGTRFKIPRGGYTREEVIEFMQGDYGFGDDDGDALDNRESEEDESDDDNDENDDDDDDDDAAVYPTPFEGAWSLPVDSLSGKRGATREEEEIRISKKRKRKEVGKAVLSKQFIEDSEEEEDPVDTKVEEEGRREEDIRRGGIVFENVSLSDDEEEDSESRTVEFQRRDRVVLDLPFDRVEIRARWDASVPVELNSIDLIGGINDSSSDEEGGEDDDEDDEDDGFDLEAAVREATAAEAE